jgi:hypothetical protein
MHSSEYTRLAQDMDEVGEVILGFANMRGSSQSYLTMTYNEDSETYYITHITRMQYRDMTFMQWSYNAKWPYSTRDAVTRHFKKLT